MSSSEDKQNPALNAALKYGRLSHAYITGSAEIARTLAAAVVCEPDSGEGKPCGVCAHCQKARRGVHPDIVPLGLLPDKREILVDQIRAVREDIIAVPNEAEKKAYVINSADSMNIAAQNALLMMLEEPPVHAVFILYARNPAQLLTTVRSRCVEIKSAAESEQDDDAIAGLISDFFDALRQGAAGLTAFSFRLDRTDKSVFAGFVHGARKTAAAKMREAAMKPDTADLRRYSEVEETLRRAEEYLALNVGSVHISGFICAGLI